MPIYCTCSTPGLLICPYAVRVRNAWIAPTTFVVVLSVMVTGALTTGDTAPFDVGAWAFAVLALPALCSALVWIWPRACVVAAPVLVLACFATITPAFPIAFAMAAPLYVSGRRGHLRWGIGSIVGTMLLVSTYRLFLEHDGGLRLAAAIEVVRDSALLVALLLLGDAVRSRAALHREAALEREVREAEHERRLTGQLLATARELHDVLAHTLTLVSIQSSVAAETFDRDPETARQAVRRLRAAAAEAMADLRGTIALLRTATEAPGVPPPVPGLARIAELVDGARVSGLAVRHEREGSLDSVRPAIGLAAYRVVQEALTNTLRHADARQAWVSVAVESGAATVTVVDNGQGAASLVPGHGLTGMAERVEALGGSLRHGDRSEGGFEVSAHFPGPGSA